MSPFAERYAATEPANIWSAPDLSVLRAGRSQPAAMPAGMFGATWGLIEDLADGAGAPVDYVALSVIATAASLIGGKRRVRPFEVGEWSEPCVLWVGAIGDPSANKSPALDAGTTPLRSMERDHWDDHKRATVSWQEKKQRATAERKVYNDKVADAVKDGSETPPMPDAAIEPDEPQPRRLIVTDTTPESMAALLTGNPTGTLHHRDELAGWLNSFERYSPGGREFWLEAFGGRPYTVDRKGAAAPLFIAFNGVSVLGGIQPDKLVDLLLNTSDDGLVARFLWAWPDPLPYRRPRRLAEPGRLERIYRRLDGLQSAMGENGHTQPVTLTLEPQAGDIFEAWVGEHLSDLGNSASLYKGFCGKLKGVVLRLALVVELLAWADDGHRPEPKFVSVASIVAALEFAETYAKPTALRVFGDAALPPIERDTAALARAIQKRRPEQINARTVYREWAVPGLRDAASVAGAIEALVDADWLRPAKSRSGETSGRQKSNYVVNPAALEAKQ